MPQANQKTRATVLQPTDVLYGDQDTGQVDRHGKPIFATKAFPGTLFGAGNGAVALAPNTLLANPGASGGQNFGQPIAIDPKSFQIDSGNTLRHVASIADNLSAQGSMQSDALALAALVNIITTTPLNSGVQVPALLAGQECEVWNLGAHPLAVYPLGGGGIGSGAVNAAVQVFSGSVLRIRVRSSAAGQTLLLVG